MAACCIDHLVITAPSLEVGAKYVREALGVEPEVGSEHPQMATHNLLVRLGATTYLEVIAVTPSAGPATRPRWFELDSVTRYSSPRLAGWVARTNDIFALASASPVAVGTVEEMSRGAFRWFITIPTDGRLPEGGIAPMLIQWSGDRHPASSLRASGCSLLHLTGHHPHVDRIVSMLSSINFEGPFSVVSTLAGEESHLVARIQTPGGTRELRAL